MTVIVRTIADLRAVTTAWRKDGLTSAVIPTMGALHEGHLTLVREAKKRAGKTVATIFVNPSQFAPTEDLSRYPRDEEDDVRKLASVKCDLAYIPDSSEVYPAGFLRTNSAPISLAAWRPWLRSSSINAAATSPCLARKTTSSSRSSPG